MGAVGVRSYKPLHGTLGDKIVLFAPHFTSTGAASNPTLTANQKKLGLASVVRNAAGDWTVTLDTAYKGALCLGAFAIRAADSDVTCAVTQEGNITTGGAGTVRVYAKVAGSNNDLTSGDKVCLLIVATLSDVNDVTVDA